MASNAIVLSAEPFKVVIDALVNANITDFMGERKRTIAQVAIKYQMLA